MIMAVARGGGERRNEAEERMLEGETNRRGRREERHVVDL